MGLSKERLGTSTTVPETGETSWGAEVTAQLSDLLDGTNATLLWLNSGTTIGVKLADTSTSLAASGTLTPTHPVHKVAGTGGAVTLDTTLAIAEGTGDGQLLILVGTSDTNTVTINNGANTAQNGPVTLGQYDVIRYRYDSTDSLWVELGRTT